MPDFKLLVYLEWVYAKARTCYAGCHARTYTGISFLSIYLSISIFPSMSLSLSLCLSIYVSIYISVFLSILYIYLLCHLLRYSLSIYLSIYLSINNSMYLSMYLSYTSLCQIYWLFMALKPGVSWPSGSPLPRTMALIMYLQILSLYLWIYTFSIYLTSIYNLGTWEYMRSVSR